MRLLAYVLQLTFGLPVCTALRRTIQHASSQVYAASTTADRDLHTPSRAGIIAVGRAVLWPRIQSPLLTLSPSSASCGRPGSLILVSSVKPATTKEEQRMTSGPCSATHTDALQTR